MRFLTAVFALLLSTASLRPHATETYLDQAYKHSAAVLDRPDDPCSGSPDEACIDKEVSFVDQHLDAFVVALRGVFSTRASSHVEGSQNELDTLNRADAAWRAYRTQICKLSYDFYSGGLESNAVPTIAYCELRQDRAYLQQLRPLLNPHRVVK